MKPKYTFKMQLAILKIILDVANMKTPSFRTQANKGNYEKGSGSSDK